MFGLVTTLTSGIESVAPAQRNAPLVATLQSSVPSSGRSTSTRSRIVHDEAAWLPWLPQPKMVRSSGWLHSGGPFITMGGPPRCRVAKNWGADASAVHWVRVKPRALSSASSLQTCQPVAQLSSAVQRIEPLVPFAVGRRLQGVVREATVVSPGTVHAAEQAATRSTPGSDGTRGPFEQPPSVPPGPSVRAPMSHTASAGRVTHWPQTQLNPAGQEFGLSQVNCPGVIVGL